MGTQIADLHLELHCTEVLAPRFDGDYIIVEVKHEKDDIAHWHMLCGVIFGDNYWYWNEWPDDDGLYIDGSAGLSWKNYCVARWAYFNPPAGA